MTGRLVARRLENVLLDGPPQPGPQEVVRPLLAVQSRDFLPALWSLGRRCPGTEESVHAAFVRAHTDLAAELADGPHRTTARLPVRPTSPGPGARGST